MTARLKTQCAIAGGGPAGLMLGLLLARAGVDVVVLEKHADFLRDFRGDTIHPSTLEVMYELGLLDEILKRPHHKVQRVTLEFGTHALRLADFSRLRLRTPYIAMMPQWDFLDLLAREARRYPNFRLIMRAEAKHLVFSGDHVAGLAAETPEGPLHVTAALTVGCDGRGSVLRDQSGLALDVLGAPMDVLWFRLPREPSDTEETKARLDPGRIFIMLNRTTYWQCAYVIAKGSFEAVKAAGFEAFRTSVGGLLPFAASRAGTLQSWEDVKLLTVRVDRLRRWWRSGLLFIGDAAHAMSPVGGVGVNLAVQDAVAAANVLARPLREDRLTEADLMAVEKRRSFATRATQRAQIAVQETLLGPAIRARGAAGTFKPPLLMRILATVPLLNRIPAYLIGVGIRPEHVASDILDPPVVGARRTQ